VGAILDRAKKIRQRASRAPWQAHSNKAQLAQNKDEDLMTYGS
jgi:hypothetical protein